MSDMQTMPLIELVDAMKLKARTTNDVALALTLNVLANRLRTAYDEGWNNALEELLKKTPDIFTYADLKSAIRAMRLDAWGDS